MLIEWIVAAQTKGPESQGSSNSLVAEYLAIVLVCLVFGLVVWVFIRTNKRKSPKE